MIELRSLFSLAMELNCITQYRFPTRITTERTVSKTVRSTNRIHTDTRTDPSTR